MRARLAAACVVLAAVGVVACGGDDQSGSEAAPDAASDAVAMADAPLGDAAGDTTTEPPDAATDSSTTDANDASVDAPSEDAPAGGDATTGDAEAGDAAPGDAEAGASDAGADAGDAADAGPPYWTLLPAVPGVDFHAVHGIDASHVWAVGTNGAVYFFDGKSWAAKRTGTETFNAVRAIDWNHVYVAGAAGVRGCSFDGGATWLMSTSPTGADLRIVLANRASNQVLVGGAGGVLEQNTLDCASWQSYGLAPGFTYDLNGAWIDPQDPYANIVVGSKGLVWQGFFTSQNSYFAFPNSPDYYAAWTDGTDAMVMGDQGDGLYTTGGNTWQGTSLYGGTTTRINAMWGSTFGHIVAVGNGSTTFVDSHLTPTPLVASLALRGVWGSADDDVWVVGDQGTILHHP